MRILIIISFFFSSVYKPNAEKAFFAPRQFDTTLASGNAGQMWNVRIWVPDGYYSNTDSFQAIFFFPGAGEHGTDASKLSLYGPFRDIADGWDGGAYDPAGNYQKFIIFGVQPVTRNDGNSQINYAWPIITALQSKFRVKKFGRHVTGISAGGGVCNRMMTFDTYAAANPGTVTDTMDVMANWASVVAVSAINTTSTHQMNGPYATVGRFGRGGKMIHMQQTNDLSSYKTSSKYRVDSMNAYVPNSAAYVQTCYGACNHCCWENHYRHNYAWTRALNASVSTATYGVPVPYSIYAFMMAAGYDPEPQSGRPRYSVPKLAEIKMN